MYHVRNSCEINIILNQSMHDRDVSISHEFSANSLLKISNYIMVIQSTDVLGSAMVVPVVLL